MIGKVSGVGMAEVQDTWKEVVEDWKWWWVLV